MNKLRCHAHFEFSANHITWSRLLLEIRILNGKQCRSRSVGFFRSQLIWIYTVCKGRVYPGSAGQGLKCICASFLWKKHYLLIILKIRYYHYMLLYVFDRLCRSTGWLESSLHVHIIHHKISFLTMRLKCYSYGLRIFNFFVLFWLRKVSCGYLLEF